MLAKLEPFKGKLSTKLFLIIFQKFSCIIKKKLKVEKLSIVTLSDQIIYSKGRRDYANHGKPKSICTFMNTFPGAREVKLVIALSSK